MTRAKTLVIAIATAVATLTIGQIASAAVAFDDEALLSGDLSPEALTVTHSPTDDATINASPVMHCGYVLILM